MDTKNSKGQALIEMILSLSLFLALWLYVQKSLDGRSKQMNKWELGHETQTQFQKTLGK